VAVTGTTHRGVMAVENEGAWAPYQFDQFVDKRYTRYRWFFSQFIEIHWIRSLVPPQKIRCMMPLATLHTL
jgi:hypothetical protein